ncbi:MAG: hypothetical protein ACOYOL_03755 [Chthoniobacterales bacterium]
MQRLTCLALVAWCIPLLAAQAQPDAPPLNAAQVLQELDAAEKKQSDAKANDTRQRTAILREAVGGGPSASRLYEEAIKNTRFSSEGANGKNLQDWARKNGDLMRSGEMQKCVQLHGRYLILGLSRSDEKVDPATLAAPSFEYARDLAALLEDDKYGSLPKEAKELMQKPASESVLVEWLNLGGQLPQGGDWEPKAGDLDGILEKNVRTHWRALKNPELIATWDFQIARNEKAAAAGKPPSELEQINKVIKPRLLFGRAEDRALLGQQNTAQREILQLVRDYPLHPDWSRWVARLRELLNPSKPSPPTPAPAS